MHCALCREGAGLRHGAAAHLRNCCTVLYGGKLPMAGARRSALISMRYLFYRAGVAATSRKGMFGAPVSRAKILMRASGLS